MGRRVLAALAVIALIAGAVLFSQRGDDAPPGAPPVVPTQAPPKAAPVPAPTPVPAASPPAIQGAGTLRGRATWSDGSPWSGRILIEIDADGQEKVVRWTESGPDGAFRFDGLPSCMVRLAAKEGPDRRTPGPRVLLPCDEEVPFVLGAGLVEIAGRVIDAGDGKPIPGATVELGDEAEEDAEGASDAFERVASDAQGQFRLRVPDGRDAHLSVTAPGFLAEEPYVEFLGRTPDAEFRVEMHRGVPVEGRVREAGSGRPVTGALVVLDDGSDRRSATSGTDGSYRIDGARPGHPMLYVLGEEWVSAEFAEPGGWTRSKSAVAIDEGRGLRKDLGVVSAPSLRGRVVDASGRPVASAVVHGRTQPPREDGSEWDLRRLDPLEDATTGADGSFRFPVLLPAHAAHLWVQVDRTPVAARSLPPPAPGDALDIEIPVPASRRIPVRVEEKGTARPLPGIEVHVTAQVMPHESWELEGTWTTGQDGSVAVGPCPGLPLRIEVPYEEGRHGSGRSFVPASVEEPVVIRIDAEEGAPAAADPESNLAIEGRVLLPDGTPAGDVEWFCERVNSGIVCDWGPRPRTDFRGRFLVTGLAPGEYDVSAERVRGGIRLAAGVLVPAGSRDVELRLHDVRLTQAGLDDAARTVRARFLAPDGRPVAGGAASFCFFGEEKLDIDTDSVTLFEGRGATTPSERATDRLWIEYRSETDPGEPPLPFASGLFGPFPPGPGEHEIRLAAELAIEGRIVDGAGEGVAGVTVEAEADYASVVGREEWTLRGRSADTGPDGRFRIGGLPDRPCLVEIEADAKLLPPAPVTVPAGTKDLLLVVRTPASAVITVLDAERNPVDGSDVIAYPGEKTPHPKSVRGSTANGGIVRLDGLDPAYGYQLEVRPPKGREDLLQHRLTPWTPAATAVRLDRGYPVEVVVRTPAGQPIEGMHVTARRPDREEHLAGATTDAAGHASLGSMAAGPVVIEAGAGGAVGANARAASVTIQAEAGKAELILDAGGTATLRVRDWKKEWSGRAYFACPEDGEPIEASVEDDGTVTLRGMRPGRAYAVHLGMRENVEGDAALLCALVRGVKAGDPPREVELAAGKRITGKAILPEGADSFCAGLLMGKSLLVYGSTEEDGSFSIPPMPDGEWPVVVYLTTADGKYHAATAVVRAGASVEIRVR